MVLNTSKLTPITRVFCNKSIWRVPLYKPIDGDYTLFVKQGFTRTFTNKTLPRSLKSSIAMILANDNNYLGLDENVNEFNIFAVPPYIGGVWYEIGWQISASWFCVCMHTNQITSLKGIPNETTNNSNDDDDDG